MAYIDPSSIRYADVSHATGLALCLPLEDYNAAFLVTPGEDGVACFLWGENAGRGALQRTFSGFTCAVYEGVRIEVEHTSAYDPNNTTKKVLSIVRQGAASGIFVSVKENGAFYHTIPVPLQGEIVSSKANERIGFTRWRIVIGEGERQQTLLEIDADNLSRE
jgi:hypothetical protein